MKPYDAATKRLIESDPTAWLRFLGLPGQSAQVLDADLTSVVAEADRILQVTDPDYLAHFEMQSSYKVDMGDRTLYYNVLAYYRYRLPVESVILLLRKQADGPALTGRVAYGTTDFRYRIVRLWERQPEELLNAPLALLPLAPLTAVTAADLPGVVSQMGARINSEASVENRDMLWMTAYLLLGLRPNAVEVRDVLKGVLEMLDLRDSFTYQEILQEGRLEGERQGRQEGEREGRQQGLEAGVEVGRAEEARRILLSLGTARFGEPNQTVKAELDAVTSRERLEQLIASVLTVGDWIELLTEAPGQ